MTSVFQRTCGRIGSDRSTIVTVRLPARRNGQVRGRLGGPRRSTGSPAAISPGTRTRAYTRLHPGCRFSEIRAVPAVEERGPDGLARTGEAGDLDEHRLPQPEDVVRADARPVELRQRQVLAERARLDRMALGLEGLDLLEREEAERPVGPAVELRGCDARRPPGQPQ